MYKGNNCWNWTCGLRVLYYPHVVKDSSCVSHKKTHVLVRPQKGNPSTILRCQKGWYMFLDLPVWVPNGSEKRVSIYHPLGFKEGTLWKVLDMFEAGIILMACLFLRLGPVIWYDGSPTTPQIEFQPPGPKKCTKKVSLQFIRIC